MRSECVIKSLKNDIPSMKAIGLIIVGMVVSGLIFIFIPVVIFNLAIGFLMTAQGVYIIILLCINIIAIYFGADKNSGGNLETINFGMGTILILWGMLQVCYSVYTTYHRSVPDIPDMLGLGVVNLIIVTFIILAVRAYIRCIKEESPTRIKG